MISIIKCDKVNSDNIFLCKKIIYVSDGGKRMSKFSKMMVKKYKETRKSALFIYLFLRALVIICAIRETIKGNYGNTFLCALSLILFTIPTLIKDKFKIELPNVLEAIIYIFIFAAEILGEINNFYGIIPYWDTILHTLNGFLCAGVGFSLVDLLNNNSKRISLSPLYVAIVAFCFSMTVGVCWEFFEYAADEIVRTDMQKDAIVSSISSVKLNDNKENKAVVIKNITSTEIKTVNGKNYIIKGGYLDVGIHDTMKDLFVNLIGATVFSIIGYIYVKLRDKNGFASNFIPQKMESDK